MLKNKATTTAVLFLLFAIAVSLFALPAANAHDPAWEIPTFAYINVSPNPVSVGQQVLIVLWLDKIFDSVGITNNYRFHNYKLTITKPDGKTETKTFEYVVDTTSSQYYPYTPDQVGTYTMKFEFPGQDVNAYSHNPNSAYVNDTYLPSSAETTLTVQEEPIPGIPSYPLPTEYWTRPIEGQNTNWAAVASNYLNPGGAAYTFGSVRLQPDGSAPNSAHIMWTKPIQFGGVVGGSNTVHDPNSPSAATGVQGATYYTGLSYEPRFSNTIIIYGRLYYSLPRGNNGAGGGYVCVDLRTGEQIWWQNYTVDPSFGSLEWFDSPNQHGVIPNGYLWAVTTEGTRPNTWTVWKAFDPLDGNWLFNITNVPSGTREYGPNGEILIYELNVANKWLALWNVTAVISNWPTSIYQGGPYTWRAVGQTMNGSLSVSYSWNVTIPATMPSSSAIGWVIADDLLLGYANTRSTFGQPTFGGVTAGSSTTYATFWALSLKPTSLGQLVWIQNYKAPTGNITMQLGPVDPVSRVFFLSTKETMQWYGYSLDTGNQLWGPVGNSRSFGYYPTVGSGGVAQVGYVAYGNLYTGNYGGEIFCFDSKTGNLVWSYGGDGEGNSTNSGLNTPWGLYPVFIGAIADGKVYVYSSEHSPNVPPYKGEKLRCLNATTGEEIWTIDSWATISRFSDWGIPVADGQIAYLNAYDMQVYAIGKGPSATTVTAAPKVSVHGNSVLVEGTVIDIAAGTQQDEQAARFPSGVPAVSEESMSDWMEYVYMQKPRPANATGVEVVVEVLDPNNNYYEVGRATSDANGFFSCTFTPEVPGKYTVIATFEGSKGYWPSHAETAVNVEEAPAATPAPTPVPQAPVETYFAVSTIAIIAAIAIIGFLILRKR